MGKKDSKKTTKKDRYAFDKFGVNLVLHTIVPILKNRFGVKKHETLTVTDEPFVMLYNHVTDLDIVWIIDAFRTHMYCLASEHMVRFPIVGKIILWFFNPIIIKKGSTGTAAVMEIHRVIKAGHNVLMSPEGVRSGNGLTNPLVPATAAVLKKLRCNVVTVRIHGGYLTSPRWGKGIRRGEITIEKIAEYSKDDIAKMSAEEFEAHINEDIYEDAYAYNEKAKIPFKGKKLAEGIEAQLFMCPRCKKIGTIHSKNNSFFCDCGLSATMDEYGIIKGDDIPFRSVTKWDAWQSKELDNIDATSDKFVVSSDNLTLFEINEHKETPVDTGKLTLTKNALTVNNTSIPMDEISGYSIVGFGKLLITTSGKHYYEISNKKVRYPGIMYIKLLAKIKEN